MLDYISSTLSKVASYVTIFFNYYQEERGFQSNVNLSSFFSEYLSKVYDCNNFYFEKSLSIHAGFSLDQAGSANQFLDNLGDYSFKRKFNYTMEKIDGLFIKYCDFVHSIKINSKLENIFKNSTYQNLSKEILDLETEYSKAMFDKIENLNYKKLTFYKQLKEEGKTKDEIEENIEEFICSYRDSNDYIIDDRNNRINFLKIQQEQIIEEQSFSKNALTIYNARVMCNLAKALDTKNPFNMMVSHSYGTSGSFKPIVRSSEAVLESVNYDITSLKFRGNICIESQKYENLHTTKIFSDNNLSLKSLYSIPLDYPWLDKNIFSLNYEEQDLGLNTDIENNKGNLYKEKLIDICVIPKSALITVGSNVHLGAEPIMIIGYVVEDMCT